MFCPPTGITGSYSVSESPFFSPIHLHSSVAWTVEDPVDSAPPGQRKKEQWVSLEPVSAEARLGSDSPY